MGQYLYQTSEVGLCLLDEKEIEGMSYCESDERVRHHFHRSHLSRLEIIMKLRNFIAFYQKTGLPWFTLFDLKSHQYIGRIGFFSCEVGQVEVGYVVHPDYWGKGYATEMLTFALDWARHHIDAPKIVAVATSDNLASIRVLEKCGMQLYKTDIEEGKECRFYQINNR